MRPQSARRGRQDATAEQDAQGEQSREHVYWKVKLPRLNQLHPTPRALSVPPLRLFPQASSTSLEYPDSGPPPFPLTLGWGPDATGSRPVLKVLCSDSAGWGWGRDPPPPKADEGGVAVASRFPSLGS